ncbi:hypothetical protein jhhlp_007679 [Lomentospora prolificans]|uniref:Transcriptional coactivator p15 (PC4) C-terminal domain-containing protein n=1 Tax=Lomentospora prolificans TaxID=41688 RepID=A0A2N3N0A2_9PEZI|nr:hypothetical protein jhhlp_007679 [Lomentospora prolificans]
MGRNTMKRRAGVDDDSGSEAGVPVAKKSRSGPSPNSIGGASKDDEGNPFWELPKSRRVTLSEFRKSTYINIREYYEKDGKAHPGKKGISLTLEQYKELLKLLPSINAQLREMTGQNFNDPDNTSLPPIEAKGPSKSQSRSNFEATSDEDEG